MLKNYMKEGQKLPLFGVGPYIVYGIAMVNVIGIILFGYVLKIGILYDSWILISRVVGGLRYLGLPLYGILSNTDYGLSLWMLTGAVLCALFAGLIFVTFKREE